MARNYDVGNHICGCHYTSVTGRKVGELQYLPQVQLKSHTTINPVCFTTRLLQTFHNPSDKNLKQVRYTFPLYDGVAVNGYTITFADKKLTGVVQQKDVARQTYQAAVDRGETAGLLESLPAGVFGITLGNVPANTDIYVDITYCGELKHDAAIDGLRYMLPTAIAPRYGSYPGKVLQSNTVAKGGISITIDVDMASSLIRKIQSPSHPIAVSMGAMSSTAASGPASFQPDQASATLTLGTTELSADFILQLLIDDIGSPRAILETHPTLPNQRAIMTTLVPKFTLQSMHPEIIFIADQSGSMDGSKNTSLVHALKIFIKSLPLGVRFNICAFGTNYKFLWPKSQAYNESNVNMALEFVNGFSADYGGTEILKPVKAAFKSALKDMSTEIMLLTDGEVWAESELFSFISEQISEKKVDARVFALGIGMDVSHTLVEGVARAGNGFAQFVTQNEETDQKVLRMLKGALYPHTKDYQIELHYAEDGVKTQGVATSDDDFELVERVSDCLVIEEELPAYKENDTSTSGEKKPAKSFFDESADVHQSADTKAEGADRYAHLPPVETPKLLQAPTNIPTFFPFSRTTVYLLLGPKSAQKPVHSVTLRASSAEAPLELTIPVQSAQTTGVATIHQLAARKAIQDLEEGRGWLQSATTQKDGADCNAMKRYESRFDELVEREGVRLGEKFQVASKWTSFVAVEGMTNDKVHANGKEDAVPASDGFTESRVSQAVPAEGDGGMDPYSPSRYGRSQSLLPSPALVYNTFAPISSSSRDCGLFGQKDCSVLCGQNTFSGLAGNVSSSPLASEAKGQGGWGSRSRSRMSNMPGLGGVAHSNVAAASRSWNCAFGSDYELTGDDRSFGKKTSSQFSSAMPRMRAVRRASATPGGHMPSAVQPAGYGGDASAVLKYGMSGGSADLDEELYDDSDAAPDILQQDVEMCSAAPPAGKALKSKSIGLPSFSLFSRSQRAAPPPAPGPYFSKAVRKTSLSTGDHGQDDHATMDALISLQTFSGAWSWSQELGQILCCTDQQALGGDAECRATALAIAWLEKHANKKKDVWEMLVAKAKVWLGKQMGLDAKAVDGFVAKAGAYM